MKFLETEKYKIRKRNFYCKFGEIDIIAEKNNQIVFCEVKTRRNLEYGKPCEAVNFYKKLHMWNTAKYYLYKNNSLGRNIRFDVIEVLIYKNKFKINQIQDIM